MSVKSSKNQKKEWYKLNVIYLSHTAMLKHLITWYHLNESCELVAAYSDEDVINQAQTIISQSN